MRRLILLTAAILAATLVGGYQAGTPKAHASADVAAASSCGNSYPDDGHAGPWRTTANGGTYHGNTVKISCPTQSTYWQIRYCIQADLDDSGGVVWANVDCIQDDGLGDFQESFSWSPEPCSPHRFRTHITNNVTLGTINKPSGGAGVTLACG